MNILSIQKAHPDHYYSQQELLSEFAKLWSKEHHNPRRVQQFHNAVQVGGRHLALPKEEYYDITSFGQSNDHFIKVGSAIAEKALKKALEDIDKTPQDVDAIFFVSVTGVATPSIDAMLMNRLSMRPDVKRIPIFGLGCVAGAAGIARVYDYLKAYPDHLVALISVELCSLTLQRKDLSIANLISSGLFGDGAVCLLASGNQTLKRTSFPAVLASKSRFYPDTEAVMGWRISEEGFRVVLQARVPKHDLAAVDLDFEPQYIVQYASYMSQSY